MNRDKVKAILKRERPDLLIVESVPSLPAGDAAIDVDEGAVPSAAWASHQPAKEDAMPKVDTQRGLSSDDVRKTFAPRELGAGRRAVAYPAANSSLRADVLSARVRTMDGLEGLEEPGIVRVTKRRRMADAAPDGGGPDTKDVLIDKARGVVGSQG